MTPSDARIARPPVNNTSATGDAREAWHRHMAPDLDLLRRPTKEPFVSTTKFRRS
jgi:hypothetical protein